MLFRSGNYRALKIVNHYGTLLEVGVANDPRHPRFHEQEILHTISSSSSSGSQYCMKLLESFLVERDTGKHLCLVMELGGMSIEDIRPMIGNDHSLPTALVKSIVKQLCLGLDYLHIECGVVHTGQCHVAIPFLTHSRVHRCQALKHSCLFQR
jgi:serine/threonine-protein kinase SRPK3